jgi:hypothetical protein
MVMITFEGVGITLYGAVSTNHGSYTVSLDGSPPSLCSGNAPQFRSQMPLVRYVSAILIETTSNLPSEQYRVSDLDSRRHTIVVTNIDNGKYTDIDYVNVTQYGTGLDSQNSSTSSRVYPSPSTTSSSRTIHKTSVGAIVGAVLGGLTFCTLFGFLVLFCFSRRRINAVRRTPSDLSTEWGEPERSSNSATMTQLRQPSAWQFPPGTVYRPNNNAENVEQARSRAHPTVNISSASTLEEPSGWRLEHGEEVDMPPPIYARVFPYGRSSASVVPIGNVPSLAWGDREPASKSVSTITK